MLQLRHFACPLSDALIFFLRELIQPLDCGERDAVRRARRISTLANCVAYRWQRFFGRYAPSEWTDRVCSISNAIALPTMSRSHPTLPKCDIFAVGAVGASHAGPHPPPSAFVFTRVQLVLYYSQQHHRSTLSPKAGSRSDTCTH